MAMLTKEGVSYRGIHSMSDSFGLFMGEERIIDGLVVTSQMRLNGMLWMDDDVGAR